MGMGVAVAFVGRVCKGEVLGLCEARKIRCWDMVTRYLYDP